MAPATNESWLLLKTREDQPRWQDPDGTLHEIYSVALFLGDALLGTWSYDAGRADLRWSRDSYAYFCPECGDIWGRLVATNSNGHQCAFRALTVSCVWHTDLGQVPGSFLAWDFENHLDNLPPAAVRHEFETHLKYYSRS